MAKILMKGNEAIGEAAIKAGCRHYFGYPITPQNEIPEYMARRMPQVNGTFVQAESEVAAINMVYGAAGCGVRAMTSSSSPGISLKQEGISYMAGAELPCVVINMVRGGPGLGGIQPAQSDYFQATRGGGHGDYRTIVLTPSTVQEAALMTMQAFDLADHYRMPVVVLGDGMIGQIMEPVDFELLEQQISAPIDKPWATTGTRNHDGKPNIINSLYIQAAVLEGINHQLRTRYEEIQQNVAQAECLMTDDADYLIAAYGTTARICKSVITMARAQGLKVGLIRPQTVWPFPDAAFQAAAKSVKHILCVEMSMGQMIDDVRLAVNGACPVSFYGRTGGMVPSPEEILNALREAVK